MSRTASQSASNPRRLPTTLLLEALRPQRRRVVLMSLLLLAALACQLVNPQVIRYFLDAAQAGNTGRPLLIAALVYILFAFLQEGLNLAGGYLSQRVGWSSTNRLRRRMAAHFLSLDLGYHQQHTPGELIERLDGDPGQLGNFFSQFVVRLVANALLASGILALLFRESWWAGLGLSVYTAITLLVLGLIQKPARARWDATRQADAEQFGYIEERISGAEEIRAIGAEAAAMRGLYLRMRDYAEKLRIAFVTGSLTFNLTNLVSVAGYTLGLALGALLYSRGAASLGTAYLIVVYVGMLSQPLQAIRQQAEDWQLASACLGRIGGFLQITPALKENQEQEQSPITLSRTVPPQMSGAALSFVGVSFHYKDDPNVLSQVSFSLPAGQVLGILGRTGSGKSTLGRLLVRLYDPAEGEICLGGTPLQQLPLEALRQRVGMVTQEVQLFQASVRDNLTFFNPAISDARLEQALHALYLGEWLHALPQGLDTPLAAGAGSGVGLSAGEAQLLAFARLFLKDPQLVVFDEASSRLDQASEARLEQAIDRLLAGRTAVVIAHRLRTLERADQILILENGRVVEYGSRRELALDGGSRYAGLLRVGLEEALA